MNGAAAAASFAEVLPIYMRSEAAVEGSPK